MGSLRSPFGPVGGVFPLGKKEAEGDLLGPPLTYLVEGEEEVREGERDGNPKDTFSYGGPEDRLRWLEEEPFSPRRAFGPVGGGLAGVDVEEEEEDEGGRGAIVWLLMDLPRMT